MGDHIDLKKTQLRLSEVGSTLVEDTYRWNTPSRMWRTLLPFRTFLSRCDSWVCFGED